ncbi:MAG: transporter substrate-binding domain-containing protein [Pseudomonadota bacterium]
MTNRLTTNSKLIRSLNTLVAVMALIGGTVIAHAQVSTAPAPSQRVIIKFATTDDFPPFNSRDFEGALVGFNIDLAQLICRQLQKECEITPYPWERLFDLVNKGEVDAVIAGHRVNVDTLAKADFTRPYFRTPGRFAVRRNGPKLEITPDGLDRRTVGVAKGTAHEAFLNTFFRTSRIMRFDRPEDARNALRTGKVDTMFGDGISLVFWVNGTLSQACCDIAGGPFLEPMFFGDGLAIGVKKGNRELRVLLDRALNRLRSDGRLVDLVQRHFPRTVF